MGILNWILTKSLTDENQITIFEKKRKIRFPAEFKATIVTNNAGRPRPNVFDSVKRKELVAKALLSFDRTHLDNIWDTYDNLKDQLPNEVVPFMSDQFGNYICFDYRNSNEPPVVFWDHELSKSNPNSSIIHVADNYIEFIDSFYSL